MAINAGRARRPVTAEDVALESYRWVERHQGDGVKAKALPAKDRKGHFFFRFESERSKELWWNTLVKAVEELKIAPEKMAEEDLRYNSIIITLKSNVPLHMKTILIQTGAYLFDGYKLLGRFVPRTEREGQPLLGDGIVPLHGSRG